MKKYHVLLLAFLTCWGATQASAVMWSQSTGAQVGFPLVQLQDPYSGPTGVFIPFAEVMASNPGKEVLDGNSNFTTNAGQVRFSDRIYVYSQAGALLLDPGWLTVSMNQSPYSTPQAYTNTGIATEATHPDGLLVHSVALSNYDIVTGARTSSIVIDVRDPVTNTPLWSQTFQNIPQYGELALEMCHVTDANADGTDDIIIAFQKFNNATGKLTMTYGVLNILTGAVQSSTTFTQ